MEEPERTTESGLFPVVSTEGELNRIRFLSTLSEPPSTSKSLKLAHFLKILKTFQLKYLIFHHLLFPYNKE